MKTATEVTRDPGVYMLRCSSNEKVYVGKTSDFVRRLNQHLHHLRRGTHVNPHLQRAWDLYGEDTFSFEILEVIGDAALRAEREAFIMREHGATLKDKGFNLQIPTSEGIVPDPPIPEGVSLPPLGEKNTVVQTPDPSVSDATRSKMSDARKGKPKGEVTRIRMELAAEKRNADKPFSHEHVRAVRRAYTDTTYHRPGGIALLARHLELNYDQVYKIVNDIRWVDYGAEDRNEGPFYGGWFHVITGPMFASKTTVLLRLIEKAEREGRNPICVKPTTDTRDEGPILLTHAGRQHRAFSVKSAEEIPALVETHGARLVGIDEIQFFEDDIIPVCQDLVRRGIDVYAAGLNTDFRGVPFGVVPTLMAVADSLDVRCAICTVCGVSATRSQRIADSDEQVLVGGDTVYEARCRKHWNPKPTFSTRRRMDELED